MKTAIIGGGAAGLFAAICLKEADKAMGVSVFEKSSKVLSKLELSGGGRCNCTNTFEIVKDLSEVYPRGHRLMKKLFNVFSPKDAINWFNSHGVKLKTEDEGRIFPVTDDSHTIINMFLHYAEKYGVNIKLNTPISSLNQLDVFDFILVTTGGMLHNTLDFGYLTSESDIVKPISSLFGLKTEDKKLKSLMGLTIGDISIKIAQTKLKSSGSLLVTHQGITGPSVLKISSYAARLLNECNYKTNLLINWVNSKDDEVLRRLKECISANPNKIITNCNNFSLPQRFWEYILQKIMPNRLDIRYKDLTQKEINRIVNTLCNDELTINGRATNKEEFVTCGGVSLEAVNHGTMQLKNNKKIFLAGEVLDIDGITGGYNFQAAWTTAYTAAMGIIKESRSNFS